MDDFMTHVKVNKAYQRTLNYCLREHFNHNLLS